MNTGLRGTDAEFQAVVPSASLTLHQTPHPSLDTWLHQRLPSVTVCASQTHFEKTLKPIFTLLFHHLSSYSQTLSPSPAKNSLSALQHSEPPSSFIVFLIIKRYLLSFFCWFFLHFNPFASSCNCLVHTLWVIFPFLLSRYLGLRLSLQRTFVRSFFTLLP